MNEFIEKNRGLLRFYCIAARAMGWILIIVGALSTIISLYAGLTGGEQFRSYMLYWFSAQLILRSVLLGLVMLGLAQFVRYLYENDCQTGWILRHGDKVLYLYAAALIISPILEYCFRMTFINTSIMKTFFYFVSVELTALVKGLISVGMGQVLRRIVPIVEESKTLV